MPPTLRNSSPKCDAGCLGADGRILILVRVCDQLRPVLEGDVLGYARPREWVGRLLDDFH